MEILNNSWVIGIGGGILSGLIVTLITRYLFSRRDNKEYLQKISSVNREVVYALRPGISEGHLPTEEVLESLVNATARRYRVSRSDAFKPKQIAEELIKEIMDSSFISSDTKKTYCDTLAHLVKKPTVAIDRAEVNLELKEVERDYRSRMVSRMSAILGLTAAMITMLTVFTGIIDRPSKSPLSSVIDIILPTTAVLAATMMAMAAMISTRTLQRRIKKERVDGEAANKHVEKND